MKKFLPILLVLALAVMVICFAACGNDSVDDTATSISNDISSALDDATTLDEEIKEDITDVSDKLTDMTDNEPVTDENMSDTALDSESSTSSKINN